MRVLHNSLSLSLGLARSLFQKTTDLTYFTLPSSGDIIRYYSWISLPGKNKTKQFTRAKKLVERTRLRPGRKVVISLSIMARTSRKNVRVESQMSKQI